MRTTTVRFDEETWEDIKRQSHRLGIAHAEFIRGAVHRRLGRLAEADRVSDLERGLAVVADRVDSIARVVAGITKAVRGLRR